MVINFWGIAVICFVVYLLRNCQEKTKKRREKKKEGQQETTITNNVATKFSGSPTFKGRSGSTMSNHQEDHHQQWRMIAEPSKSCHEAC